MTTPEVLAGKSKKKVVAVSLYRGVTTPVLDWLKSTVAVMFEFDESENMYQLPAEVAHLP